MFVDLCSLVGRGKACAGVACGGKLEAVRTSPRIVGHFGGFRTCRLLGCREGGSVSVGLIQIKGFSCLADVVYLRIRVFAGERVCMWVRGPRYVGFVRVFLNVAARMGLPCV